MSFTNSFTEPAHAAEWLLSEANGHLSREVVTLISGQNLPSGRVIGIIAASGKATELAPTATDGSQVAAGIMYDSVDASSADTPALIIRRNAEVKDGTGLAANDLATNYVSISWPSGATTNQKTQATAELAALGIVLRT